MGVMRGLTVMTVNCQTVIKVFPIFGGLTLYKNIYFYFIYIKNAPRPENCLMTVTVMTVDSPNMEILSDN